MIRKHTISAMVATIAIATSGAAVSADVPESSDPIKVIMNDWTGQHVSTKIAGALLEKMGIILNMSVRALCLSTPVWPRVICIFKQKFGVITSVICIQRWWNPAR